MRIESIIYTDNGNATVRSRTVTYAAVLDALKEEFEALSGKKAKLFVYDDNDIAVRAYSRSGQYGWDDVSKSDESLLPDGLAVVMRELFEALKPQRCFSVRSVEREDNRIYVTTLAGRYKVTVEPVSDDKRGER